MTRNSDVIVLALLSLPSLLASKDSAAVCFAFESRQLVQRRNSFCFSAVKVCRSRPPNDVEDKQWNRHFSSNARPDLEDMPRDPPDENDSIDDEAVDAIRAGQFSAEYPRDPNDAASDLSNADAEAVRNALLVRERARRNFDFRLADEVRYKLMDDFGVYINDKLKVWSTSLPEHLTLRRDPLDTTAIDVKIVNDLICRRKIARDRKNFALADEFLKELNEEHGVFVKDDIRMWSTRFGGGQLSADYKRDPHDDKTVDSNGVDAEAVEKMLSARERARKTFDFKLADELRDTLIERHNVYVNDVLRMWSTNPLDRSSFAVEYRRDPNDGSTADSKNVDTNKVEDILLVREKARKRRDFKRADQLRDELLQTGVYVDDSSKTWSSNPPVTVAKFPNKQSQLKDESKKRGPKRRSDVVRNGDDLPFQPVEQDTGSPSVRKERQRRPVQMSARLTTMTFIDDSSKTWSVNPPVTVARLPSKRSQRKDESKKRGPRRRSDAVRDGDERPF